METIGALEEMLLKDSREMERHIMQTALLIKHIEIYRKFKPIYKCYLESSDKEKFLRGHESDVILFKSAAKALKGIRGDNMPSLAKLRTECKQFLSEKDALYEDYKKGETKKQGT